MSEASVQPSLVGLLRRLWLQIGPRRQRHFVLLFALMVLASIAEVLTIGVVLPFLMALAAPQKVLAHPLAQPVLAALDVNSPVAVLATMTAAFCGAALGAGALRVAVLWVTTRLSCATGADISIAIYTRTLYQPYLVHVARNTSEVVAGVTIKTNHVISNVIGPTLILMSSAMMLVAVTATLMAVDVGVAISAFLGFGMLYGGVAFFTRKRLALDSERISVSLNRAVRSLNEGLGGIRDVLIDGTQKTYCEEYHTNDLAMRRAQASQLFVSQAPRYVVEALGMMLIAGIAYRLAAGEGGIYSALPVLGALALGAQRLLPVLQQAYAAWASISGGRAQLRDTVELLEQPLPKPVTGSSAQLQLNRAISLRSVSFRYSDGMPWILDGLNLEIPRGMKLGVMGSTGAGKSTLIDLLMGLLPPQAGALEVDGVRIDASNQRAWQDQIAHVPQAIFLADRSVAENIALGQPREQVDLVRVRDAARRAQIGDLIESWPAGYDTMVGERGIRLSGGQRQRIGIARALYKRASVIVFDEATSALDSETEAAVMASIEALGHNLTIIIVAHRLATLSVCDWVIQLGKDGIQRAGTWSEVVDQHPLPSPETSVHTSC